MSDLMNMLANALDADTIAKIGEHVGADSSTTKSAIGAALPALLGALGKNASSKEGAGALLGALTKDHSGGILDNVAGMVGGGDGAKILQHVLGSAQPKVSLGIGKLAGLDAASSQKLMETLAPVVMGAVAKKQQQEGMDADGLAKELAGAKAPGLGGLESLLDGDGDGDLDLSDLMKHGSKFFG
jgi:hypothetical protein